MELTRELNPNYWVCDCGKVTMKLFIVCGNCKATSVGRLGVDQDTINQVVLEQQRALDTMARRERRNTQVSEIIRSQRLRQEQEIAQRRTNYDLFMTPLPNLL